MKHLRIIPLIILIITTYTTPLLAQHTLTLATTTSTYETGLLDHILQPFEEKHNVKVHVISVGTGKAIKLAENGDADVILVHARAAEDRFIAQGYGVNRRDVMYNDFVILGPAEDPAGIEKIKDPVLAFSQIYKHKQTFISRGDHSGTHKKEMLLWNKAELIPNTQKNRWYLESGQGMAATLRIADEKNSYVLLDRATYLFNKDKIQLKLLVEGHKILLNPYGIIAVSPYLHPHVQYELSMALIAWITSPPCQEIIARFKVNGNFLFKKNANHEMEAFIK